MVLSIWSNPGYVVAVRVDFFPEVRFHLFRVFHQNPHVFRQVLAEVPDAPRETRDVEVYLAGDVPVRQTGSRRSNERAWPAQRQATGGRPAHDGGGLHEARGDGPHDLERVRADCVERRSRGQGVVQAVRERPETRRRERTVQLAGQGREAPRRVDGPPGRSLGLSVDAGTRSLGSTCASMEGSGFRPGF